MKRKRFTEEQVIGFLKEAPAGILEDLDRRRYSLISTTGSLRTLGP